MQILHNKILTHQQVHFCEMCFGDHPTGYCPPQLEEEVNYVERQVVENEEEVDKE